MSSEAPPGEPSWFRVGLALRNTRRIAGPIEHPFHVIHALLRRVLRADKRQPVPPWCWHPADPEDLPATVEKDRLHRLAVLFPGLDAAERFFQGLSGTRLENFVAEGLAPPQRRSLSVLERETPPPDWTAEEICLDFATPLAWEAKPGPQRWALEPRRLARLLHHRLALFLGFPEPAEDAPAPGIRLRTECLERIGGHPHRSKSSPGTELAFAGLSGPLYLRGDWPALWAPLLYCSELQLGSNTTRGQGCYRISSARKFFDLRLALPETWQRAAGSFRRQQDQKGNPAGPRFPDPEELALLAARAVANAIELAPAKLFEVPKKEPATPAGSPELRLLAALPEREQFIHYTLHRLLQPAWERLFFPESIGSRMGRSREDARPMIQDALEAGCTHVVEADVEDFFDHIDWAVLGARLREHLPLADSATLALIEHCVRQPVQDAQGRPLKRSCGLLQGSPLSSLLANLYLHGWDAAMRERGWRFVRAVDDLRLFAESESAAQAALREAEGLLEPLGLRFKPAKLAVHDLRATPSFRFLGLLFGPDQTDGRETGAPLRRALYLTRPETWAGLEDGALVLREGDRLAERVPLHRVGEVVLLGAGGVSTALIDRCLERGIPVSFCTQAGRHCGTLHPDARTVFARIARHHERHRGLGLPGRAQMAARVVQAKLANYAAWVGQTPPARNAALGRALRLAAEAVAALAARPDAAAAIEAIRGHEGAAARRLFPWVNAKALDRDWASAARLPHERRDRWNLLLDTLSFLLFNRLHTACRARGLDPWLGFLHSPDDRYPSLVYDLMEPFRARLERFALWLVNVGALTPSLTALQPDGRWGFSRDGWRALILQFEKQLDVAYSADQGRTWRQLLDWQVENLVLWADHGIELRLHSQPLAPWRKPPAPPPENV
jgi:CRISPR-associated protein Cas1